MSSVHQAEGRRTAELLGFYENEGFKLVAVSRKTKRPVEEGWPTVEHTLEEMADWVSRGQNVGIQMGEVSGWLCCVDLDCPEAARLAPEFLPKTLTSGKGGVASHYFYRSPGLGFAQFRDTDGEPFMDLKASNNGKGHQVVVEPSVHPEKGPYQWMPEFNPAAIAHVEKDELRGHVGRLAAATVLAKVLPDRGRHDLALGLSGYMQSNGMPQESVLTLLTAVWECAGAPPEAFRDLGDIVPDTARRLADGGRYRGYTWLQATFPGLPDRLAAFLRWTKPFKGERTGGPLTPGLRVSEYLPDAPVPDDLVMPRGTYADDSGVYERVEKKNDAGDLETATVRRVDAPLFVGARTSDIHEHTETTRLVYRRGDEWRSLSVPRSKIAIAREAAGLADHGVAVSSNDARDVVRYLLAFEKANLARLPHTRTTQQLGWQGEGGKLGFLWGSQLIGGAGLEFRGADLGDDQIAAGFHARGSHDEWKALIGQLKAYPRALLALYAGLVPPLISIVGGANFVIDWSFVTSTGKTTALKVGASAWGCPDERADETVLYSWDASRVWIERASAILNGLPLILDETKRARNERQVAQTLYDVANGRGRGRGTPKGLARAGSWNTVLLSTGEAPITSFSQDGGTRARCIPLWGAPFGGTDANTAKLVSSLGRGLSEHYGHAAPKLVEFLAENRDRWPVYREVHRKLRDGYADQADGDSVLGRMSDYLATLSLVQALAVDSGATPDLGDPIDALWDELAATGADADRAQAALEMVYSWAARNESNFYGRHREDQNGDPLPPAQGWAGRWDKGDDWQLLSFFPDKLRGLLKGFEFDPEAVLRTWKDREWLDAGERRYTKLMRFGGQRSHFVAVKRHVLEPATAKVGADDEDLPF